MGRGKRKSIAKRDKTYRKYKGYTAYYARMDCGCCDATMWFSSIDTITAAFNRAGLDMGVEIIDDVGIAHEGIDTFYGFSVSDKEMDSRSLGYLMSKLQ